MEGRINLTTVVLIRKGKKGRKEVVEDVSHSKMSVTHQSRSDTLTFFAKTRLKIKGGSCPLSQ